MPIDPTLPYDDANIFAKILRGEIPSNKVYEDEWAFAFEDINPQAEVHTLVVPKGRYVSWDVCARGGCSGAGQGAGRTRLPPARQYRRAWRAGSAAPARPYLWRTTIGAYDLCVMQPIRAAFSSHCDR